MVRDRVLEMLPFYKEELQMPVDMAFYEERNFNLDSELYGLLSGTQGYIHQDMKTSGRRRVILLLIISGLHFWGLDIPQPL